MNALESDNIVHHWVRTWNRIVGKEKHGPYGSNIDSRISIELLFEKVLIEVDKAHTSAVQIVEYVDVQSNGKAQVCEVLTMCC